MGCLLSHASRDFCPLIKRVGESRHQRFYVKSLGLRVAISFYGIQMRQNLKAAKPLTMFSHQFDIYTP